MTRIINCVYEWGYGDMGAGLQVFSESGAMKLNITTQLTKILGSRIISGTGEIDLASNIGMQLWYFIQQPMLLSGEDIEKENPTIWIDRVKQKICWKEIPDSGVRITYGVY